MSASAASAEPLVESLDAFEHLGRLLMVDIAGEKLSDDEAQFLSEARIGGVCLFARNLRSSAQTRALTTQLREAMPPGALIAIDQEGGAVQRARFVPHAPSPMCLGASGDVALCQQVSQAVARGLRTHGINWNLAPTLDLNTNPRNPVIAERAFGQEAEHVARMGLAWIEGHQREGVATCIKHFPGHGDTQQDSHLSLPVVNHPLSHLETHEFAPFRRVLPAARAVLNAHVRYTLLDDALPASLSPRIQEGLLRAQWGYDGIILTDALNMRAITGPFGQALAAQLALRAGADMVMVLGSLAEQRDVFARLRRHAAVGPIWLDDVPRRIARLQALAHDFPSLAQADIEPAITTQDEALMRRAWRAGLTAHGSVPVIAPGVRLRLIAQTNEAAAGVAEPGVSAALLAERLEQGLKPASLKLLSVPRLKDCDWRSLPAAETNEITLLASNSRLRIGMHWRDVPVQSHLALWNPYSVADVNTPALISYGYRDAAIEAIIDALRGEIKPTGQLPVTL